MAIKERKQITGTTAQINAYAGHEGQIVWDKDKKTLVGMSGTAGTNYPLAQQAYVDTQFLPLTGGTVSGDISLSTGDITLSTGNFLMSPTSNDRIVGFMPGWDEGNPSIHFRSSLDPNYPGSIVLATGTSSSETPKHFTLDPKTGKVSWMNLEIDTIYSTDRGWFVRYTSGIQFHFGYIETDGPSKIHTFQAPYANTHFRVTLSPINSFAIGVVQDINTTGFKFAAYNPSAGGYTRADFHYIAVGFWY